MLTSDAVDGQYGVPVRQAAEDALGCLQRAANAIRWHLEQSVLRQERLTWTGFAVLRAIFTARRVETRRAAQDVGITKATLTGVVDTLVRRGLVRRVDHPTDRRLVLLELTRTGHRLVRQLLPAVAAEEAFTLAGFEPAQISEMTGALRQLVEHLETDGARDRRR